MGVFECSDVIRPITTHQRCVAKSLQRRYYKLLLFRHNAGEHFDVRKQSVDRVIL